MKPNYIISLLCCYTCLLPASLKAQEEAQSRQDSIKGFNALDYTLQKRYIPAGKPVSNADKGKNFAISGMVGIGDILKSDTRWSYNANIAVSKQVSPFNTYRLNLLTDFNRGKEDLSRYGVELSHLFNLSDYIGGYRENNRINLYSVAGIGGYAVKKDGEKMKYAAGIHAGIQLAYHISDHWDWFIEPKAYLYSDNIDLVSDDRRYNLGWRVMTGLTFRFTKLPIKPYSLNFTDNLFLETAMGVQGDYSALVRNIAGKTPGPTFSMSIGKWFMPIGFRLTAFTGFHNTATLTGEKHREMYAGGRLEGLINLNTIFMPSTEAPRLEINLAGGVEGGVIGHRGRTYAEAGNTEVWFRGFTGAVQGVYFLNSNFGLTGELRYSPSKKADVSVEPAQMHNLSLIFGVQYRRRENVFKERAQKYHFEPYNFAYTSLGYNYAIHGGIGLKNILKKNGGVATGIGHWFDPFSGIRGGVEIQYHDKGIYPLHISADYLLNLTNLIANYMPERIFDLNAFAGGVYTHNAYRNGHHWGLEAGLQQMFHLNETWGIYVEESGRMYKGKVAPDAKPFTRKALNFVLDARLGFSYRF